MSIFEVLKQGKALENPASWKNVQWVTNTVFGILSALCYLFPFLGVHFTVTDDALHHIAQGVSEFLLVANLYLIPATSNKVGIPVSTKIEGD